MELPYFKVFFSLLVRGLLRSVNGGIFSSSTFIYEESFKDLVRSVGPKSGR